MKIAKILPVMGLLVLSGTAWGQGSGICHNGSGPNQSSSSVDPNLILIGNSGGNNPIYFCKKQGSDIIKTIAIPENRFNSSSGINGSGTKSLGSAQGSGGLNATSITLTKAGSSYGSAAGEYTDPNSIGFHAGPTYPQSVYNFMAYYNLSNSQLTNYSGNRDARTRAFCWDKQQVVIDYLKANPQIFLANGVPSIPSDRTTEEYVAKNIMQVNGATVTTYFRHSPKNRNNKFASSSEGSSSDYHHYIYCLVSVVPDRITINLDTLKRAGAHQITYSVQPQN